MRRAGDQSDEKLVIVRGAHGLLYNIMSPSDAVPVPVNETGFHPGLVGTATIFALIDFVANEAGAFFPDEIARLQELLKEQTDKVIERANR